MILSNDEAAKHLGIAGSSLEKHRVFGTGPRFLKIGKRKVGYRLADLDEWLDTSPTFTKSPGRAAVKVGG